MQVLNFIHDSFQEFQPYQSLVLFCNRCNLSCKYCYNLQSIRDNVVKFDARDLLDTKINMMHEAVVFLGGEPTLHNDLPDLLSYSKYDLNLKTKIFTNGQLPEMVYDCKKYLDAISIDFKCVDNVDILGIGIDKDKYLSNIRECINICNDSNIDIELRTTMYNGMSDDELLNIKEYSNKHFSNYIREHIFQKEFKF